MDFGHDARRRGKDALKDIIPHIKIWRNVKLCFLCYILVCSAGFHVDYQSQVQILRFAGLWHASLRMTACRIVVILNEAKDL